MLFGMLRGVALTHRLRLFVGCYGSAQRHGSLRTSANCWSAPPRNTCAALILCIGLLTSPDLQGAAADDLTAGRAELQTAIIAQWPNPNPDSPPAVSSINEIKCRIPARNYSTTTDSRNGERCDANKITFDGPLRYQSKGPTQELTNSAI
jgi:hypothetical protein